MIGHLTGTILGKSSNWILLEVAGVGYEVFMAAPLLARFKPGDSLSVFTHLHVREDQLTLFGFETKEQLELFRLLLGVSGVGPKVGLDILSQLSVERIKQAVAVAQADVFAAVPGIGKKTASKIVLDLQTKLGKLEELDLSLEPEKSEAVEALVSLGYKKGEAVAALKDVDTSLSSEKQIKQALRSVTSYRP